MAGIQIDRVTEATRHVPDSERLIAFTIEGKVSRDKWDDFLKFIGDVGNVTCNATFTTGCETPLSSPSILTEYVLVDEVSNLFELAVTKDGMREFVEAEHGGSTGGGALFGKIIDHYDWHHDRLIMEWVRKRRGGLGDYECGCPLEAVKSQSPLDFRGFPITVGFRPWSLIEMIEAGVSIEGVKLVRRRYLDGMASKLRADLEAYREVEKPAVI